MGRIATPNTAVFICDMQEKFSKGIKYFPEILLNTKRVLGAAKILNLPVVYTEQYPKGIQHAYVNYTSFYLFKDLIKDLEEQFLNWI